MDNGYFEWLVKMAGNYQEYAKLLNRLYNIEYIWDPRIETDANRADDGLGLRLLYSAEVRSEFKFSLRPCSVLEMLLGLSHRIEIDIMGEPGKDNIYRWFWVMIHNLGLDPMTNDFFDEMYVDHVIGNWLSRNIDPETGKGGIFPVNGRMHEDQRKLPIWEQMGEYLSQMY